jgi:hypothetical protein
LFTLDVVDGEEHVTVGGVAREVEFQSIPFVELGVSNGEATLSLGSLYDLLGDMDHDRLSANPLGFAAIGDVVCHLPDDAVLLVKYEDKCDELFIAAILVKNQIDAALVCASVSGVQVRRVSDNVRFAEIDLLIGGVNYENGYFFPR